MARPRRPVLVVLLAVMALGVAVPLAGQAVTWQQARGRVHDTVDAAPTRAVVIVLGAGLEPDGRPSPFLQARLEVARELFLRGGVTTILVSGDGREPNYHEPRAMRRWLVDHGVPDSVILEDAGGLDTYATCVRARRDHGFRTVTMVTQGYHLARAVATCRLVGVDAIGVADQTAKSYTATWNHGVLREWPARVKMLWDVLVRPDV